MQFTDHQSKYFAYDLTRRCPPDSVEKLVAALADAQVDLNPHQIDAALFAFRSPLSKGALLADEVGLGKTIEAGLVLSQRWAERKRRMLVITPSNLRKQWYQELSEKFFLPCRILESKSYNAAIRNGEFQPFAVPEIVICSYQFARNKAGDVFIQPWDLVVIDEAHRLRNVYKPGNIIANTLKKALAGKDKLLLTATPLQNTLLELFGLVSFIDEHTFGDLKSFREQYSNLDQKIVFETLKSRLKPICHRTLRRQVEPYIKFTKRYPLLQEFTPDESEDRLYTLVTEYLQRDNLQALPASQRTLMTLVLRKLLASSSFAIAGALNSISNRLKLKLAKQEQLETLEEELSQDYESLDETSEEWEEEEIVEALSDTDREAIEKEVADLDSFAKLATSIDFNAKGKALLKALEIAFAKASELGAAPKAIVFTESRKTQNYLLRVLSESPYGEGVVLFNGSNTDERSKSIYAEWQRRHAGTDRITGSRSADMRSALVDYFREEGRIMIATEAGAEGINLQFCSLVVNYDLPWNPQRIEQRIGRCHRYGQKHDVVVVNFLNRNNAADQRVLQLLSEKFQLFEGVFGASDEVLGAIESGVDFEKRIVSIYQQCRKSEEIQKAFDQLQLELNFEIESSYSHTNRKLLENFDDEVIEKLRVRNEQSRSHLNRYERLLMQLTKHELKENASWSQAQSVPSPVAQGAIGSGLGRGPVNQVEGWDEGASFTLNSIPDYIPPTALIPLGLYELPRRSGEAHLYRLNHPLAEALIDKAKNRALLESTITFTYSEYSGKISAIEPYIGTSGTLSVSIFSVDSLDQSEDHLIVSACTDAGELIEEETAARLLTLPGTCETHANAPASAHEALAAHTLQRQAAIRESVTMRNARFFDDEVDKLEAWADDLKIGLEREIKDLDRQIRETRRTAKSALTLEEKLAGQKQVKSLETERTQKRRALFDAQDAVDKQREDLIAGTEAKLAQRISTSELFQLKWTII